MTKFAVETANIPMTQESLHVKITNEDMLFHKASQPSLLCGNTETVT
jgi:hypothetical protein